MPHNIVTKELFVVMYARGQGKHTTRLSEQLKLNFGKRSEHRKPSNRWSWLKYSKLDTTQTCRILIAFLGYYIAFNSIQIDVSFNASNAMRFRFIS